MSVEIYDIPIQADLTYLRHNMVELGIDLNRIDQLYEYFNDKVFNLKLYTFLEQDGDLLVKGLSVDDEHLIKDKNITLKGGYLNNDE